MLSQLSSQLVGCLIIFVPIMKASRAKDGDTLRISTDHLQTTHQVFGIAGEAPVVRRRHLLVSQNLLPWTLLDGSPSNRSRPSQLFDTFTISFLDYHIPILTQAKSRAGDFQLIFRIIYSASTALMNCSPRSAYDLNMSKLAAAGDRITTSPGRARS